MVRGSIKFKCDECGKTFSGLNVEWHASHIATPQPCTHCGSRHTYPRVGFGFFSKAIYKPIWKQLDEQKGE